MHIFEETAPLLAKFKQKGHRAFIVGGAVRDEFLNRRIADVDIVTSAQPEEIYTLFPDTFTMNNQHQTVIVRFQGRLFEVTTERGSGIEEDLTKRDFTINSMAISEDGKLLDPTNGQADLKQERLRSFEPMQRMSEDPLRLLRALRFVSELNFSIEKSLLQVIKTQHAALQHVAIERIVKEFEKLFRGRYRHKAVATLIETNMYQSIPKMELTETKLQRLQTLPSFIEETAVICWTAISRCFDLTEKEQLKSLTLSNRMIQAIRDRLHFVGERQRSEWTPLLLYKAGVETALDVERLRALFGETFIEQDELLQKWEELPIKHKNQLAISGTDLLQQVRKKGGPWLKEELEWAQTAVVMRKVVNEKGPILELLARRRQCER